jgi:hypothetical protein
VVAVTARVDVVRARRGERPAADVSGRVVADGPRERPAGARAVELDVDIPGGERGGEDDEGDEGGGVVGAEEGGVPGGERASAVDRVLSRTVR